MSTYFDHGYALLIGVDENTVPEFALPAVSKDIAALYDVLTHPERCAYRPEQVKRITGSAATREGILDGLSWLHEQLQQDKSENATAVVFYSGHGLRATAGDSAAYYLIPYHARRVGLTTSALRATDFAATIQELQPKRLLVALDCCHAAGVGVKDAAPLINGYTTAAAPVSLLGEAKGFTPTSAGAKGLALLQTGAGRAILSSSQGHQPSYVRQDRKMSIFTYHLIEALTGHAQPRTEGAHGATAVLVSDIMSHVYRQVPASARTDHNADQTPDYQISGNFPVALLLGGKGLSKGQPAPDPLLPLPATTPVSQQATNSGSGAIAQGSGAVAAGERGIAVGGNVTDATLITGDNNRVQRVNTGGGHYIQGNVNTRGDFIGRDRVTHGDDVQGDKVAKDKITIGNMTGNTGVAIGSGARSTTTVVTGGAAGATLDHLFVPLLALAQVAPPEQRNQTLATVQAIKAEAAHGAQADDRHLARQIEALVALLPGAAGLLTFILCQPPAATAVGPVTEYVLEKLAE